MGVALLYYDDATRDYRTKLAHSLFLPDLKNVSNLHGTLYDPDPPLGPGEVKAKFRVTAYVVVDGNAVECSTDYPFQWAPQ